MKNRPIKFAGRTASSIVELFTSFLSREQPIAEGPVLVQVWDARRDAYRSVDLSDRDDPLWAMANELARFSGKPGPRRTAA